VADVVTERAERVVAELIETSADLRGCAVVEGGRVLAASTPGDPGRWGEVAARIWSTADAGAGGSASQLHVGTERGELFAARDRERSVVAVSERFALASLVFCDLRAALRQLGAGGD
jgi:hypothetical protein